MGILESEWAEKDQTKCVLGEVGHRFDPNGCSVVMLNTVFNIATERSFGGKRAFFTRLNTVFNLAFSAKFKSRFCLTAEYQAFNEIAEKRPSFQKNISSWISNVKSAGEEAGEAFTFFKR